MGLQVCTVGAECGAWTPEPRRQPEMHSSRTRTPRAHDTSSDGNARGLSIRQVEALDMSRWLRLNPAGAQLPLSCQCGGSQCEGGSPHHHHGNAHWSLVRCHPTYQNGRLEG